MAEETTRQLAEAKLLELKKPWMIAVWPGMGHVGLNAAFYLASRLSMRVFAEFAPQELFDSEHVDVEEGLIQPPRLPRSRLLFWRDPLEQNDLVMFLGEAQPPMGKRAFCHGLIQLAKHLGIVRIFTFAAMATAMTPQRDSRVFVAATQSEILRELARYKLTIMKQGRITGLNGVLLGEAATAGLHGACLLGEMPQMFAQVPYPPGSLAILEVFCRLMKLNVDLEELRQQAEESRGQLTDLLTTLQQRIEDEAEAGQDEWNLDTPPVDDPPPADKLSESDKRRIETLFEQARDDRSKAYELKR